MNLMKATLLVFCAFVLAPWGNAQIFVPVTLAPSGTQVFSGQEVTITPAGSTNLSNVRRDCNSIPYWIGANYNGIAGSYSFAFSFPVTRVRFNLSATNIGEVNSFYINGSHYPLTPANLDSLTGCDTQYRHQLSIDPNGNAVYYGPIVAGSPWMGRFGSGMVTIDYPGTIDSVRIHNNGIEGGTTVGFSFWGFYALATNDSACYGDTLHLFAQPDLTGPPTPSYSWTGPNGFTSNEQNPKIPNSSSVNEGMYVVTIRYGVNETKDTTIVKLRTVPDKPTITADSRPCQGSTVQLGGSSSNAGVDFIWTGPRNYNSKTQNSSIRNFQERDTGVYQLMTILNGCPSEVAELRLGIAYSSKGDTAQVKVCKGGSYDFFGRALSQEGIYEHKIVNGNKDGCDSFTYVNLTFTPPVLDTVHQSICSGGSYDFNGRSLSTAGFYVDTFRTSGGCDSVVLLNLSVNSPVTETVETSICEGDYYYFNGQALGAGVYFDTLKTRSGCDSVLILEVTELPKPEITVSHDYGAGLCIGDTVLLTAQGAAHYLWFQEDRPLGEGNKKPVRLSEEQNHISVVGIDYMQCSDSMNLVVDAVPCCELFIPNAFSPNGDGHNDLFDVQSMTSVQAATVQVFNRFGQLVFKGDNLATKWDGTFNGIPVDAGVYFYVINVTCLSGVAETYKGDLTLLR